MYKVTFDVDLIKRGVQKLSTGIICVLLAITVFDIMAHLLKNIVTSIELAFNDPCARIHNRILPLPRGRYPGVRVNRYSQRHLPLPRGNYLYP